MYTWVLFVWLVSGAGSVWNYDTEKECLKGTQMYRNAVCVKVYVPSPIIVPQGK